ncbi:hypothetical protein TU51_13875 [Bacillus cytotoxicus]|nr:hypothetical protein CG482_021180 [Bacillus cytotoxicus]KMT49661.1 hypothetical protein TU51_13875 [Bacillus cytotoxicus]
MARPEGEDIGPPDEEAFWPRRKWEMIAPSIHRSEIIQKVVRLRITNGLQRKRVGTPILFLQS